MNAWAASLAANASQESEASSSDSAVGNEDRPNGVEEESGSGERAAKCDPGGPPSPSSEDPCFGSIELAF